MKKSKVVLCHTPGTCVLIAIITNDDNPKKYVREYFRNEYKRFKKCSWAGCDQHKFYWMNEKTNTYTNYKLNITNSEDLMSEDHYNIYKHFARKNSYYKCIPMLYEKNSVEKINMRIAREFVDDWKCNEIIIEEYETNTQLNEEIYSE